MDKKITNQREGQKASDAKIVMLPTSALYPHPDNPRKDVGDVSELAESIKANGVLQNLTVVPSAFEGQYIVIIGHRRLAASKKAGLDTVPCVISNMSKDEQIATMLTENMQRTDLTIYEQAKAFQQLSIDMGMSIQEIAEKSGFSEATVKKRTRLAELDEKSFKKACARGATLFDFAELDKIEDSEAKQRCLEAIGTQNWKNTLHAELEKQRTKKKMQRWISQLDTFATRIEKAGYVGGESGTAVGGEYVKMNYHRNYGSRTKDEIIEKPEDANEIRYFYIVSDIQIDVYKEYVADSKEEQERRAREEIRNREEAAWEKMEEIQDRHKKLRRDFVLEYGSSKSNIEIILRGLADGMLYEAERNYYSNLDAEDLCAMLEIPYNKETHKPDSRAFASIKAEQPYRVALIMAYWYFDKCGGYARHEWSSDKQQYVIKYHDNQQLDNLYYFLEELGYERSDEERQLSRGMHELFYKEESEAE